MRGAGPGRSPWYRRWLLLAAVGVPVGAAVGLITLRSRASTIDLAVLSLCAVLAVGASGSRPAAALAAGSAALSFDYFLTHPYGFLLIAGGQARVAALAVLVFGMALGQLAASGVGRAGRVELLAVVLVAGLSQALPGPGRWAAGRHGIDLALAILVFATAAGLPPGVLGRAGTRAGTEAGGPGTEAEAGSAGARRLGLVLVITAIALPVLAWGAARIVAARALRRGVLALGVAPAEIGSVATVGIGGGDPATAALLLIGSTLITVTLGPVVLGVLDPGGTLHPLPVLGTLALVVAAPMAAGLVARAAVAGRNGAQQPAAEEAPQGTRQPPREAADQPADQPAEQRADQRAQRVAGTIAFAALVVLVGLVSSEVAFTSAYVPVAEAAAAFLAGSTVLGWVLGLGARRPVATGVLLTTSMRDFAVAAAVASAAAGPGAAAPLSLYGVLAIVWGVALAAWRRRRS
ncbi:MAG TPA: DUF4118 domain-containing protein [Actinomycetota bacterium]|nr:DUF4118 domain-containing protein [Actinomycetota bacterium]